MIRYQIHFEKPTDKGIQQDIRMIKARNEAEAIVKVKSVAQGSFGHWVNHLASEVVR